MNKTILVVDDEPNYRSLIEYHFDGAGWRIITAASGAEALDMLRFEKVDLVITDMKMPKMDGLDLVTELRKLLPAVPVIVMTGYALEDRLKTALSLEKLSHLFKPFSLDDLASLVTQAVGS